MTPVTPSSVTNFSLIPGAAFTTRKNNCFTRCKLLGKSTKQTLSSQKYILPLSTSVRLFPQFRIGCSLQSKSRSHAVLATGTDVAIEEPVETGEESLVQPDASVPPAQTKRSRPGRKSDMPPVKNEELVPGATFMGKVRSIQPFGAFVDFGAFTDGLVHVSQLSDSFVKDVGSVVSLGQEVKVRLVEANTETGRISLTMRETDDASKKDAPSSSDKPARRGPPRSNKNKNEGRKSSKFVKGQDLEGTVKNMTRSGAFISLPEGEEGFLPQSEESDGGLESMMGGSSLQVGQEVSVRVLRIARGQVTLTMKKEEDGGALDMKLSQGVVVHEATNPFVLAFRENKDIAAFLDERDKEEEETSDEIEGKVIQTKTEVPDQTIDDDADVSSKELDLGPSTVNDASTETALDDKDPESVISSSSESVDGIVENIEEEDADSKELAPEGSKSAVDQLIDETIAVAEGESDGELDLSGTEAKQILSSESVVSKEITESQVDDTIAKDEVQIQTPSAEDETPSETAVEDEKTEDNPEEKGSIIGSNEDSTKEENDVSKEFVENRVDNTVKDEVQIPVPDTDAEIPSATPVKDETVDPLPEKNGSVTNTNGQAGASPPKESSSTAAISPALVKQLRDETGAGMMDCKKALSESGGDIVKAQEFLRKKGLASADKKASRATAEGRIGSYIHDSRIGVLVEVNCETDFVSRGDIFKELVDDLAMQVAACPQVQYLVTEDVSQEIVDKEREIEMQKEDLLSKPEQIRSKIVEGRIRKRLEELALLEQPYIKNDKVVVKDFVKQTIATIGENIKVKRFVRYNLGEGLEKKSQDFAAEVAAQTAAKPVSAPAKEQPSSVEATETVDKAPPKASISAALVKQLREETGAGMMDCKKALSETGGDLEKAQEYLRKKGLSAADKKSSRIAAEGRIGSYIHDSRIGVLIEVNCETDFVGRSEKFKELVDDLAMQIVACPQVQYVSIEDIPESIVIKEKEIEMQREDLLSKPENIREKIVEGRVSKRLGELVLSEQPFIKDDSVLVKDLVKQTVAALGENIKVRRFVRFTLGEEIESEKLKMKNE